MTRGPDCLKSQQICSSDGTTETCAPCADGHYAKDSSTCAEIPGVVLSHDFGVYHLAAAAEVNSLCQSWTLGNDAELWVNGVEMKTSGGYHHSNWLFVPDNQYAGPDGVWTCDDRGGYSELRAAVAGGVLFAQTTQAKHQVQKLQDGVAVRIPPYTRIIGGTHLLNHGRRRAREHAVHHALRSRRQDVTVTLAPFHLTYQDLTIPPKARSQFSGECDSTAEVPNVTQVTWTSTSTT